MWFSSSFLYIHYRPQGQKVGEHAYYGQTVEKCAYRRQKTTEVWTPLTEGIDLF